MSADFLELMAARSRERVAAALRLCPAARMLAEACASPAPLPLVLNAQGFDIIAELKPRSPADGTLKELEYEFVMWFWV